MAHLHPLGYSAPVPQYATTARLKVWKVCLAVNEGQLPLERNIFNHVFNIYNPGSHVDEIVAWYDECVLDNRIYFNSINTPIQTNAAREIATNPYHNFLEGYESVGPAAARVLTNEPLLRNIFSYGMSGRTQRRNRTQLSANKAAADHHISTRI